MPKGVGKKCWQSYGAICGGLLHPCEFHVELSQSQVLTGFESEQQASAIAGIGHRNAQRHYLKSNSNAEEDVRVMIMLQVQDFVNAVYEKAETEVIADDGK